MTIPAPPAPARLLLAFLATAVLAACSGGSGTVVIGTAGPWKEGYALNVRRAVEMAADEVNARGGAGGHPVEVAARDDEGDGVKAASIARGFLDDARVVAVVGHANSGGMVGAAPMYDHGLVAVSPSATSPEITGISRWVFRVTTNDSVNGARLAEFAGRLGSRRVAILYENDVYGRDLAAAFRAAFRGGLVGVDPIPGDGSRVEPFISYYRRVQPDLVFAAGTTASGRALLREARRQGLRTQWLAGDGWPGVQADTAAAEGAYIAIPFSVDDPRPEAQRFVAAFRDRYHQEPDANAAMAYDATLLLLKGVAEVGADRPRLRDWVAAVRGARAYHGVTGDIRFGADGDPEGTRFVMTRVSGGVLRPVEAAR
ncbi:MAG: putative branched-chain amino acid-binding protein [Gemmatimonadetes bacterium]|nr:putative branched-chain amino acid-binding protein [Gemmatimonadota bacterium]